tara:strand:- start:8031 stop:8999 length:969 start_codon:yes stop_codon:yes gene_type:complete
MSNLNVVSDDGKVDEGTDPEELNGDPFQAVIAMESEAVQREIETMQIGEGDDEVDENASSAETSRKSTSSNGETANGKRPGIDTVLTNVENELGAESAEVVRSIVRSHSQIRNEWKEQQTELRESLRAVKELQEANGQAAEDIPDPSDPLNRLTDQQWDMFNRMAEKSGYVRKDQMEEEKVVESSLNFVQDDITQGIEKFGDKFGYRDEDGAFHYGEEVAEKTQEVYDRLHADDKGLTARDVYLLAEHDNIVSAEVEKALSDSGRQSATSQRRAQGRRAQVESRSTRSGTVQPRVYKKGESFEDTIARASLTSLRDAPDLPR